MKNKISRKVVQDEIEIFFKKKEFTSEEVRKIKRLAMKYNIKLGENRKKFCKKCLCKLNGKTRIGRVYKMIECGKCGSVNKFKMKVAKKISQKKTLDNSKSS